MSVPAGYKATEVGVIPEDWDAKPLKSLNPFITSGSRGWAKYYADVGDAFVRITNLSRQNIYPDMADLRRVKLPAGENEGTRTGLRNGDVLVSITADIGIIGYVDDRVPKPAYINQHIATVRVDPSYADSKFLSYFLATEGSQRRVRATSDAGAKAGMSLSGVGNLLVACPSTVSEQAAIANALSDMDEAIAAVEAVIAKKRALKTATMQALLAGIRRLPGFSGEWKVKALGDVAQIDRDNLGSSTSPEYEFRYISLEDVDRGTLRQTTRQTFATAPSRARRRVTVHDVLFGTVRPNLQSHLLVTDGADDLICSTGFAVIRCDPSKADPKFVFFNLFGGIIEKQIERLLAGSNYPAISNKDVAEIRLKMPDVEEQKAVSGVIFDMDLDVNHQTEKLAKLRRLKTGMMQQLLTGKIRLV